jgi:6-phosphogluconate dehydrogenase-like protein
MTPRPVGVVGLGVMGSAMSSHLLAAGFPVLGFDIDPGRRAEHEARGGTVCDSAADVARSATSSSPRCRARPPSWTCWTARAACTVAADQGWSSSRRARCRSEGGNPL